MHRAVFLDRDGTTNAPFRAPDHGRVDSPAMPEEFHLLPAAGEAVRAISEAGLLAVVAEPGVVPDHSAVSLREAVDVILRGRQAHGHLS